MNVTGETRGRKLCIRRANASTRSLILPRYFFRFSSATECVPDNFGAELPNFKAAHLMSETKIEENKQARKGTRATARATEASTTTVMRFARTLANEDGAENLAT